MRDYKIFIPSPSVLAHFGKADSDTNKPIFTRGRLLPEIFVGKKAYIHDGRQFRFIFIKFEYLDYPVGSFIFTKKTGIKIHTSKSKKKDKKKL